MKKILKQNYKFISIIILLLLSFTLKFPYYIDAPGGIDDVSKKIEIKGFKSEGSFNLTFVREYEATIPTLLISLFNKDFNVIKKNEVLLDNETVINYQKRDKVLMEESISNAIYIAYKYANKNIKVLENSLYVTYVLDKAITSLKSGDQIIKINNKSVNNKEEILNIISRSNVGDKLDINVVNNNIKYKRYATVFEKDNTKLIGILLSNINKYNTNPNVKVITQKNESGSSGGLITALSIYNSLTKKDITKGLTIVGTGTIDCEGNIGSIGGVKYKLKSAVKSHADLFIVPRDENYEEALKLKKENNYNIKIVGVNTFLEALNYLKNIEAK